MTWRQTTTAMNTLGNPDGSSGNQHHRGGPVHLSLLALAEILSGFPRAFDGVQIHGVSKTPAAGQCPARPMQPAPGIDLPGRTTPLFAMDDELLTTGQAAQRLGISTASLYSWLAQSNAGTFRLHGEPVTIDYVQSGARGGGRIRIKSREVARLLELMRVRPSPSHVRRPPVQQSQFPGITVKLGRPRG